MVFRRIRVVSVWLVGALIIALGDGSHLLAAAAIGARTAGAVSPAAAPPQKGMQRVRFERHKLAKQLAESDRTLGSKTERAGRIHGRLQRMLAILEILDLPAAERPGAFAQLGISRSYRGQDLIIQGPASKRAVVGVGLPVHPAQLLSRRASRDVPDGAVGPLAPQFDWEAEWEAAQTDAEDTIAAMESLQAESESVVSELQGYSAEASAADCTPSGPSDDDAVVGRDCVEALGAALAEALGAVAGYLENSALVNAALSAARNAVMVAAASFTAGTLTFTELAAAAGVAIAALTGSTAAGWFAAAAITVATATITYAVWKNCIAA